MPDYEINTFAELCQRIIDSDGKGVENLVAVTSPGAFACTIKIEGDGYCGEIPGFLLQSLSEVPDTGVPSLCYGGIREGRSPRFWIKASFGVLSRVAKVLWIWCFVWLFSAWA